MIAAQMNPSAITREDPGKWGSLALTFFIHGALVLLLFYGVQWQRRPPVPVQVALVRSLPPLEAPPVIEPAPPPKPAPEPKAVEPPPVKKADIVLPKPPEKPIKKPPEPVKPVVEPPKPKVDARENAAQRQRDLMNLDLDRMRRDQQARTSAKNKADQDSAASLANGKALTDWIAAISLKVGGQLSAEIPAGSPQPRFLIELLPGGEVGSVRLERSSGNKALDDAMERAIKKSSPLPMPARPEVFDRNLHFVFKPRGD